MRRRGSDMHGLRAVATKTDVHRLSFALDRRLVLKGAANWLPRASLLPTTVSAASGADTVTFTVADLHSPYARFPVLLATILARVNQFAAATLEGRTGDYIHVAEIDIDPAKTYRLATNAWTGINQEAYLGTTDLPFETVAGLELKAVAAAYRAAR